jgi:YD repeat-containing protein
MSSWRRLALTLLFAATVAPGHAASRDSNRLPVAQFGADADAGVPVTADARWAIGHALASHDAAGRPFAVVDKRAAHLYVFDAAGRLVGHSAVLAGQARGDGSVPGIGRRPVNLIRPFERTTPAGRFESKPGRNLSGEAVVWIDYETGIAIHRLRPGASEAVRARALQSAVPEARRQSYGCVVVPPAFFDAVVMPALGQGRGVVYVLPEEQPVQALFAGAGPTRVAGR